MAYRLCGILLVILGVSALGQAPLEKAPLDKAYAALRAKDYGAAIAGFRETLALDSRRADVHKDLAYTLLTTGETEAARDQFAEAMRLDASDDRAALEYAFLCYETKQAAEARRVFDRLRRESRAAENRATAEEAFENIDRPLRESIARWQAAVAASHENFSAHEELARLAEQ